MLKSRTWVRDWLSQVDIVGLRLGLELGGLDYSTVRQWSVQLVSQRRSKWTKTESVIHFHWLITITAGRQVG